MGISYMDLTFFIILMAGAGFVLLEAERRSSWNYSLKWTCIPWTAIFFLHHLVPWMEFSALALAAVSAAAIFGKVTVGKPAAE